MSDNYRFGLDDVGEGEEDNTDEFDAGDSLREGFSFSSLVSLPITVFAVYAFLEKSTVISVLTALLGGSGTAGAAMSATIIGTALWVVGGIVLASIGILAVATVVLFLTGLIQRDTGKFALSLLGGVYFGAGYLGATYLFGALPLLVGFMLTSTLLAWGGLMLVGTIAILAGIVIT